VKQVVALVLVLMLLAASVVADTGGVIINVPAGADLQAAINIAQPGDVIELEAGATFTGTFAFNNKQQNGKWITVRSSRWAELPTGRVSPSDAPKMARLQPADTGVVLDLCPTSNGYTKAHNLLFVGIEIQPSPNYTTNNNLIKLGTNGSWQTSAAQAPEDITFDRCYIHGLPNGNYFRACSICGTRVTFTNNYISEFHCAGFDAQALLIANAPGPIIIENNYLEASGENLMVGGLDLRIPGLIPSDITIRKNYFYKPLAWKGVWSVKNLFELKTGQRVLIEDNVFENNWIDAQAGIAIQFTPRNQDGGNPQSTVADVVFQNNVIKGVPSGFSILGTDDIHPSGPATRITIRGNLVDNFNVAPNNGGGRLLQLLGGHDIIFAHNTAIGLASTPIVFDGPQVTGLVFTDNIFSHGDYGVFGSGVGEGKAALDAYAPSYVYLRNVMIGSTSIVYPSGNYQTQ